jgi:hypothetical protein
MMTYRMVRTHPTQEELPLIFGGPAELVATARENGPGRYTVDEFAASMALARDRVLGCPRTLKRSALADNSPGRLESRYGGVIGPARPSARKEAQR